MEAIRSELDVERSPVTPSAPPFWLPPSTTLLSAVEFRRPSASKQWIARSLWSASSLRTWMQLSARLGGWSTRDPEGHGTVVLERGGKRLGLTVLPDPGAAARGSVALLTEWPAR
jgi:hypothetical protein